MQIRAMIRDIVENDPKLKSAAETGLRTIIFTIREYIANERYDPDNRSEPRCNFEYPVDTPKVLLRYLKLQLWSNYRISADIQSPYRDRNHWTLQVGMYDEQVFNEDINF